jgi:hypothetical protein
MKNSIRRKIQTLTELELPLLIKNNFFVSSYHGMDDDGLGRDLEPGPPPQSLPVIGCYFARCIKVDLATTVI